MSIEVHLFGELRLIIAGQVVHLPTKPTENLLAVLVSRRGKPITRTQVAEIVWPDVDPEKAANRLRTALVYVRKALHPFDPISSDRQSITFSLEACDLDLAEADRLYRRSRLAQSPDDEAEDLRQLLGILENDFLANWREDWTADLRFVWRERRIESALRLASIGMAIDDFALAESESLRAMSVDEFSEEAWGIYLRAMMKAGRHVPALDRFNTARKSHLADIGFDFSKDLLQLAKRVSDWKPPPTEGVTRLSPAAREIISNSLELSEPELLLPVLASESFRAQTLRNPTESWKLLADVLERTEGTDDNRVKAIGLLIRLADIVDQYGLACDYAEWLIENLPPTRQEHRYAVNNLGFLYFELREWDEAFSYLRRFQELADEFGTPYEASIGKGQIASLNWHQGKYDLALDEYYRQVEIFSAEQSLNGLHNLGALHVNIGTVLTIQQRWAEAKKELGQAYSIAVSNGFDYMRASSMAPLGLTYIMTGNQAEGRKLAALGLAQTYRSRYTRMHQISADYAAGALTASGYAPQGIAVLDAYTEFRTKSHHDRSVAEQRLADWIRNEFPVRKNGGERDPAQRLADLVADSCDMLDSN